MTDRVDFTVVVATRDRPRQLTTCLAALAAQRYPADRVEVTVVDDGSGSSSTVMTRFAAELDLRSLRTDGVGPAAARNAGSAGARGRFLAFTDDDCEPATGWLAELAEGFAAHPGCMLGGHTVNGAAARASQVSQSIVDAAYAHYNPDPSDASFFASNNMAVPADAFRELGGFDGAFRTAEDRDLCHRWRGSGRRLVFVPTAVVRHRHPLGVAELCRQHFGYGQGAFRFHRSNGGGLRLDGGFYREVVRRQLQHGREAPLHVALLAVQQVANLAGYSSMAVAARRRSGA